MTMPSFLERSRQTIGHAWEHVVPGPASEHYQAAKTHYQTALFSASFGRPDKVHTAREDFNASIRKRQDIQDQVRQNPAERRQRQGRISDQRLKGWIEHVQHMADALEETEKIGRQLNALPGQVAAHHKLQTRLRELHKRMKQPSD